MMSMIKLDISSLGRSNEVLFDYSVQYYHNYSNTMPYNDRIKLMALHRQALSGEYCISKDNAVPGFFDFVGKDIVSAWKDLKKLSTQDAKCGFVELLNDKSDRFGLWLSDIFASKIINDKLLQNTIQQTADSSNNYKNNNSDNNNNNNINNNNSSNNNSNNNISLPPHITIGNSHIHKNFEYSNILEKPQKFEMISAEHDDTNNQHDVVIQSIIQSPFQSKNNANDNFSSNNDNVIKYDNNNTATPSTTTTTIINSNNSNNNSINNNNNNDNNISNKQTHSDQESIVDVQINPCTTTSTQIKPAALWCKMNEAKEFIKETSSDPESIVTISAGETLTIKVPVMPDIDMFFWEFVLEKYDIGFGVYMELSDTTTTNATTICSTSNSYESIESNDVIELIPLERRICTEDVIVGCHRAITERERAGVRTYHLKFENRYSFFRKKFLHYKIYCRRS